MNFILSKNLEEKMNKFISRKDRIFIQYYDTCPCCNNKDVEFPVYFVVYKEQKNIYYRDMIDSLINMNIDRRETSFCVLEDFAIYEEDTRRDIFVPIWSLNTSTTQPPPSPPSQPSL